MSKSDRYGFTEEKDEAPTSLQEKVFPGAPPPPPVPFRKPPGGAILKEGQLTVGAFTLTDRGLQVDGSTSKEDWTKVGQVLFKIEGSIQWLIGDWLAYGEDIKWGDIPQLALDFGRAEQTLHDYASVARRVQFSFRQENLSYTHHVVAANAGLTPEQLQYALEHAVEKNLSVSKFRQWINEQKGESGQEVAPALQEQNKPRYNPTKAFDHAIYMSERKDLKTVDLGMIRAAMDDFDLVIKVAQERKERLALVMQEREKGKKNA